MDYWSTKRLMKYRFMKDELIGEEDKKNTRKNDMLSKSKEIVKTLGKKEDSLSDKNYYVYEVNGLKIEEKDSLCVEHKGECVLSSDTYIPGEWEDSILKIYQTLQVQEDNKQLIKTNK